MNLFLTSTISSVARDIFPKAQKITKNKKLIFIPTAGELEEGAESWLEDDRRSLAEEAGFDVSIFTLTGKTQLEVLDAFKDAGAICVNGGNNYYLMKQVRLSGFDKIIKKLVTDGLIYIGSSAGSMIAGPNFETDIDPRLVPEMSDFSGLNLTDLCIQPHWGSEYFKEGYQKDFPNLYTRPYKIIALNDSQYVHVRDDWYQIVDVSI